MTFEWEIFEEAARFLASIGGQRMKEQTKPKPAHRHNPKQGEQHCPSCTCNGRRVPVRSSDKGQGTIAWAEFLEAYVAWCELMRGVERPDTVEDVAKKGFSFSLLAELLGHEPTTWRSA